MSAPTSAQLPELGLISQSSELDPIVQTLAGEFGAAVVRWNSLEEYLDSPTHVRLVLGCPDAGTTAAEFGQAIRFATPESSVAVIIPKPLHPDELNFARRSGANLILLESEVHETSKLDYAIVQAIHSSYIPVKLTDLDPDQTLSFDLFHLLPLRGKFLKLVPAGDPLDTDRFKKLSGLSEYYIRRSDLRRFHEYSKAHEDLSSRGLERRCRAQFLLLSAAYSNMLLNLTDQSGHASFQSGIDLFASLRTMVNDLIICLGSTPKAQEIINQSAIGAFGSIDRAVGIVSYAAIIALRSGELEAMDLTRLMLAALLAETGLLLLPREVLRALREDADVGPLGEAELRAFHAYPKKSVEICLARKLQLDENMRNLMLSNQERSDGKGFPLGLQGPKIPEEAQLIQLARKVDQVCVLKLGSVRREFEPVLKEIIREQLKDPTLVSPTLTNKLRGFLKGDGP